MNDESYSSNETGTNETELRQLPWEEVLNILKKHKIRLESRGVDGVGADFAYADLRDLPLRESILREADLTGADLSGADLCECDLRDADLSGAKLDGSDVEGARLQGSVLKRVDLSGVKGLVEGQLARTDLSNAMLPENVADLDGLQRAAEIAVHARSLLYALILACVFTWHTVGTTQDADLIRNVGSSKIPFIETTVGTVGFFWVAALVLFAAYLYFHLNLQNLWGGLSNLPRVFPDGVPLDKKIYPWLFTSFVRSYFYETVRQCDDEKEKKCKGKPVSYQPYSGLSFWVSLALGWFLVPVTILLLWLEYLPRHDYIGTAWLSALLVLATAFGVHSFSSAKKTLNGEFSPDTTSPHSRLEDSSNGSISTYIRCKHCLPWAAVVGVICLIVAWVTIVGTPEVWDDALRMDPVPEQSDTRPGPWEWIDSRLFADLRNAQLSVRKVMQSEQTAPDFKRTSMSSASADSNDEQIPAVEPAILKWCNLRGANAIGAFLVKAELRGANLCKSRFYSTGRKSDLREAKLTGSDLRKADLRNCQMQRAYLDGADLNGAMLQWSNLEGANLIRAELNNVDATKAMLTKADLRGAKMRHSIFQDADLRSAKLCSADEERADLRGAYFGGGNLKGADLSESDLRNAFFWDANLEEANLKGAELQGANLQGADFWYATLEGTNLCQSDLQGADFWYAHFKGADLSESRLQRASLQRVDLRATCLRRTSLEGADLEEANLQEADLRDANLEGATLNGTDLTNVKNLTQKQLDKACGDEETKLPPGMSIKTCQ